MAMVTKDQAKRAGQKLWVAGTAGAYFSAFTRTVMQHVHNGTPKFDWDVPVLIPQVVCYSAFIWLLAYFFTSNMRREGEATPTGRDVWFDVVQSVFGLRAAFYLGFLDSAYKGPTEAAGAVVEAHLPVVIISGVALLLFGSREKVPSLNFLRVAAVGVAGGALLSTRFGLSSYDMAIVCLASQFLLWALIIGYFCLSVQWRTAPPT